MSRQWEGSGSGLSALVTGSARGWWQCNGYKWLTRFALMGRDGINERLRLGSGLESYCLCGKERFSLAPILMREKLWWKNSWPRSTSFRMRHDMSVMEVKDGQNPLQPPLGKGLLHGTRQISDVVKKGFSLISDTGVLSALCPYWDLS